MREVRWERMFPDELEAAFVKCPVAYLSYGLCEPHGPQNAVGLDALKAHAICCLAARTYGGIVAPPDYWHIHEIGGYAVWAARRIGERRPWLTAVPPWIHFKNLCYHLRAVDAMGFHVAIILTGHYGENWKDLKTLVRILQPHFGMKIYGLPDFEANQPGFGTSGEKGDHAGKVETSLLWALEPDCVDFSRLPSESEPGLDDHNFAMGPTAYESSRRIGEQMAADEARWLGEKAETLLREYQEDPPKNLAPLSFMKVEEIWARDIEPRLKEFLTMKELFEGQIEGPPPESRWRLNWKVSP